MVGIKIADLRVEKIGGNEARDFIKEHHYTGGCAAGSMTWGIFDDRNDELVGAIAFHTPISEQVRNHIFGDEECDCDHFDEEHKKKQHVTELHRLATLEKTPHNTESWFISRALDRLKEYKPKYWAVVSFADQTEGHLGTIYQASNAIYYGTSDTKTFYRDQDGVLRPPRNGGHNITIEEAEERGWEKEKREAKHRYLFLLPDPYQTKDDLKDMLAVDTFEYPDMEMAQPAAAD